MADFAEVHPPQLYETAAPEEVSLDAYGAITHTDTPNKAVVHRFGSLIITSLPQPRPGLSHIHSALRQLKAMYPQHKRLQQQLRQLHV